jgi:esterase/lipase superfamily enzyme
MATQIFYATNRAPVGDATADPWYGTDATPGKPELLRTGLAEVTTAAEPEAERRIERLLPDATGPGGSGLSPAVEAWGAAAIAAEQDAILFIHGYANAFEDAILRAAQLRDFYALPRDNTAYPTSLLAFSWPSEGKVLPIGRYYPADRADAKAAAPALAALLAQVAKVGAELRKKGRKLHLIAHSMGNWALRNGILAYAGPKGLFDEAVLTAADEDHDAYADAAKLGGLAALARRVTIHVYDMDLILTISRGIHGVERLGQAWPLPLPAAGTRDDAVVRVSPVIVEQGDFNLTGHQYYRNSAPVRRDTIAVLEGHAQAAIRGRNRDPQAGRHFVLSGPLVAAAPLPDMGSPPSA